MNTTKIIIASPIHKETPTESEKASLVQCAKILGGNGLCLVCPEGLDVRSYTAILDDYKVNHTIERFDGGFFDGIDGYNKLMLSIDFYQRFAAYDYMLIYQLDAFVFRDELNYWCEQGYDFIGAPWTRFDFLRNKLHLIGYGVNGGLSLRKISSFIKILSADGRGKILLDKFIKSSRNEDEFYSIQASKINPSFKVAPFDVAMNFSFEYNPEKLFKMTSGRLPFGCHAWARYDPQFWARHIKIP